jgi:hypothetical protein
LYTGGVNVLRKPPVPVTARLSKLFYDRLGEEIAKELVDWFNQVDATYRSDLREVNELNFARFDAKLEQHFAQFDAKLEQRLAQSEAKAEQRLAQSETKAEQRFAAIERQIAELRSDLKSELRTEIATARAKMERRLGDQTRWMFLCWATLLASNIALWMR